MYAIYRYPGKKLTLRFPQTYNELGFPYITDYNMPLHNDKLVEIYGDNTCWFLEEGTDGRNFYQAT